MNKLKFRFRYVNEITGVFVLGVILLLITGMFMTGRTHRWFARKYTFDLLLPEKGSSGLKGGNQVFILGINVGMVDEIYVEESGRMRARIRIQSDFERFVRQDSVATVKKTFGVAGDSFVEILKGTGLPLPKDKPTIVCLSTDELPGMMEKLLDEIRNEMMPLLKKGGASLDAWTSLATNVNQTQADLRQLVLRLDKLVMGLEEGKGSVGKLLTEETLAEDLQQLVADSRQLLTQGNASMQNLEKVLENIGQATVKLPQITDAIASEAKDLPGLIIQSRQTLFEVERLLSGLQKHWLVRKYIHDEGTRPRRIPPTQMLEGKR